MTMSSEVRIIADKVNTIAEGLSEDFKISKCESVGIIAQILLDDSLKMHFKLPQGVEEELKKHVLASCLGDTKYLFEG